MKYARLIGGILLSVAASGTLFAQDGDDRAFVRRFIEEMTKKIPPLIIPPPSTGEMAAPRPQSPSALTMAEAQALMGIAPTSGTANRLPGGKLAIIDLGFEGLKEWLAAHPEERRLVIYRGAPSGLSFKDDPTLSDLGSGNHGYHVYRVARAVLPDAPMVLYVGRNLGDVGVALLSAGNSGVSVSNVSLGFYGECEIASDVESEFAKTLRAYLPQREAFAFISAGNARDATHSWISTDANANGFIDFRQKGTGDVDYSLGGRIVSAPGVTEGNRVLLQRGVNRIFFAWDALGHPDADYELRLDASDGTVLAAAAFKPGEKRDQCLRLAFDAPQAMLGYVRVRKLAGSGSGVPMRLTAEPIGYTPDFNGLQTARSYSYRDDPFVIYVGAFGKVAGGLSPSTFSDIGRTSEGKLVPNVLGPGQLVLDGRTINGTSFASPFLTALFGTRVGYNIKNLVERSSSTTRFAPGVQAFEKSRWGIPDARKVVADLQSITGPTKLDGVSHRIEGDNLVIPFAVSRCCMEGLLWYIDVALTDAATQQTLTGADGKPLIATATMRVDESGYLKTPASVRFPLARLAALKGKSAMPKFGIRVRLWPNPPPGSIRIDTAPDYRLTL